jgi:myo-inositol 2-dehydrogenase/D-chiro-inositol 1-dehydrogenase
VTRPFSVGVVGGSTVTQAIHIPLLATLPDLWRIVAVSDDNPELAVELARRCDARACADADTILNDPAIEVVALCSPPPRHALEVVAACRAGKLAVLCDKPLGLTREDAAAVRLAAEASGTIIMVGTMHLYDPAWIRTAQAWAALDRPADRVQSVIYLPPNSQFLGMATDEAFPAGPPPPSSGVPSLDADRARLRGALLNLGIHHVPLVRRLYPRLGRVLSARVLSPFGYSVFAESGDQTLDLLAMMPGEWDPEWRLDAKAGSATLSVDFPPSYVFAGSARGLVEDGEARHGFQTETNGYLNQWRILHDRLTGPRDSAWLDDALADLEFALDLADQACALLEPVS